MSLPVAPDRSTAGIVVDPQTLERVVPASKRLDGTVRKEIKVRPGFTPVEDISRYRPRAAAAAAPPTVPGSQGRSPASSNPSSRNHSDSPYKSNTSSPSSSSRPSNNSRPREPRRTGGYDVSLSWDDDPSVERVNIDDAIEGMGKLGLGAKGPEEPLGTGSKAPGGGAPTESVSATIASSTFDTQSHQSPPPLTDPPTSSSPTDPIIPPPAAADVPVGASGLVSSEKTEKEWKAARPPSASSASSGATSGSRADRDARWVRGEAPPPFDSRRGGLSSGYNSGYRGSPPAERRSEARQYAPPRETPSKEPEKPLGTGSQAPGGGAPTESVSAVIASSSTNPPPDSPAPPPLTDPPTSSSPTDPSIPPPAAADVPIGASALVSAEQTERDWKAARPPSPSSSGSRADRDKRWVRGETPSPPAISHRGGAGYGYGSDSGTRSSPAAARGNRGWDSPPSRGSSGRGGFSASERSSGSGMRSSPMAESGTRGPYPTGSPSSASWSSPPSRGSGLRSSPSSGSFSTPVNSPPSDRSSHTRETPPSDRIRKEIRIRGGTPGSAGSLASRVQGLLADTGRPSGAGRNAREGESRTSA